MSITFNKLFSSITESTVWCEDSDIRVVWITMLAMADKNGRVWGSIPGLANRSRVPLEKAEEALKKFLSPDTYSRTKEYEGRRIEEIDGGWRLLNHAKYRALRDEEERKAYKREWIAKKRGSVDNVDTCRPPYTKAEAEAEAEAVKQKRGRFTPPSLQEVIQYCRERNNTISPNNFLNFYEAKGWMIGKSKMKDWKAAIRTWEQRQQTGDGNGQRDTRTRTKRHIDKLDEIAKRDYQENGFTDYVGERDI